MSEFVRHVTQPIKPVASRLRRLDIELTERCNNNCIHCCINRPANDAGAERCEMTTAQVRDVLQQAADLGCLHVRFTGGEPLLRPDFEELYLCARRLGLRVLLYTNGRLITPQMADLFVSAPPLVEIEITVYGMHAESYEAVTRAPGSFAQFWRGVSVLLARKVPFIVKSALLPQNRHEMDEFESWAKTIPWMTRRPSYSMFFELRSRRDDEEKNRLIESLRLSPREGLAVYFRDEATHRRWTPQLASKHLQPPGPRLFTCSAADGENPCVDPYGRVQPCMALRAPALARDLLGSRGHSTLRDALEQFSDLREQRATSPEYLRRCAVCFLKPVCEQCPAKSWAENGTLDTPVEYQCEITHSLAGHLGWLGENERGWEVVDGWERVK